MKNLEDDPTRYARGRVALILASSLGLFLILFTGFAIIEAGNPDSQLSENATQLLSAAIGGMIGVLAGYVGGVETGVRIATPDPAPVTNPIGDDPGPYKDDEDAWDTPTPGGRDDED